MGVTYTGDAIMPVSWAKFNQHISASHGCHTCIIPQHNSKTSFLLSTYILSNRLCWFQIFNFKKNQTIHWCCAAVFKVWGCCKIYPHQKSIPKTLKTTHIVLHLSVCLQSLIYCYLYYTLSTAEFLIDLHCSIATVLALSASCSLFTWRVIFTR